MVGKMKIGLRRLPRSGGKRLALRAEECREVLRFARLVGEFCRNALHRRFTSQRYRNLLNVNNLVFESDLNHPLIGRSVGRLNTFPWLSQKAWRRSQFERCCNQLLVRSLHNTIFLLALHHELAQTLLKLAHSITWSVSKRTVGVALF
jgi:hypothetical protein